MQVKLLIDSFGQTVIKGFVLLHILRPLSHIGAQGLSSLCVQRVIWTPRTLFFDSLDTQKFMLEYADDDFP